MFASPKPISDVHANEFPVLDHQATLEDWQFYVAGDLFLKFKFSLSHVLCGASRSAKETALNHGLTYSNNMTLTKTENPIYQLYVAIIVTIIGVAGVCVLGQQ